MGKGIIRILMEKGVTIPNPESVHISDEVDPERISGNNVILYTGTKIFGKQTLILENSQIGYEAPVTLEDTLVGTNCRLKGGFFKKTVFAGDNSFGSGAHVREGTILEEQANAAHTVGLKQTILFPFVTLGSLINFCDCFMAGGTSRQDHSEVGSSFIHFNYTPNQDKATPSMMGDVPRGVMLRSKPIFLGGQGGLVGPVKIGYGNMSAAGAIIRKNELREDMLLLGGGLRDMSMNRKPFVYKNIRHIFNNNIEYIASLTALRAWYGHVRPLFGKNNAQRQLIKGMQTTLDECLSERVRRFKQFLDKVSVSKDIVAKTDRSSQLFQMHKKALEKSKSCFEAFEHAKANNSIDPKIEKFITCIEKKAGMNDDHYIPTIKDLSLEECAVGTRWLEDIQHSISSKLTI